MLILITFFGLQWACDTFSLPVHMHKVEKEVLERNIDHARMYGFQFPSFEGEIIEIDETTSYN